MAKRMIRPLALSLALCALLCVGAGAIGVEQIQVSLPSVTVYVHAGDTDLNQLSPDRITATLGGKTLQVEGFRPSDQGIYYMFMLDISKSVPESHFQAAKQAIHKICAELRPQDRLALISFGSSVTVLSTGAEPVSGTLKKLDALTRTDSRTRFYDAMDTLVKTASRITDLRRIAVVVSDGIDDTEAGMSQGQMENVLKQSGIAVYALCTDAATQADQQKFRSFIRLSGGELYPFHGDSAQSVLDQLIQKLGNVWMLQLLLSGSWKPSSSVPLHVELGSLGEIDAELEPDYWQPDQSPPYVTDVNADPSALSITVSFSEPVKNADAFSCYRLTDQEGKAVKVTGAAYVSSDRRAVLLTVPALQGAGACTLEISGPTDLSDSRNALIPYRSSVSFETSAQSGGAPAASAPQDGTAAVDRELRNLLLAAAAAVVAVCVGIALILRNARPKTGASADPLSAASTHPEKPKKFEKQAAKQPVPKTRFFFKDN